METLPPPYSPRRTTAQATTRTHAYAFGLLRKNGEGKRAYRIYVQRSVLVCDMTPDVLMEELETLLQMAGCYAEGYSYELVELGTDVIPFGQNLEGVVLAFDRPLRLTRRSPATGIVYDDSGMRYCPHSRKRMAPYISV